MRVVDLLHELQELDTQLDGAMNTLGQIQSQIGDDSSLEPASREVTAAHAALHEIDSIERDLELQADTRRAKIAANEKKLYGGTVNNPKELGSLGDEIAMEKKPTADSRGGFRIDLTEGRYKCSVLHSPLRKASAACTSLFSRTVIKLWTLSNSPIAQRRSSSPVQSREQSS